MVTQSELVEETRRQAFAKHDKLYVPLQVPAPCPLLPVSICVAGPMGGVVSEQILWRLGDPTWDPKCIAGRMCQDLGLPPATESEIEQQIIFSLQGLQRYPWKDLGGEKRVLMQVYVRHQGKALRDEMEWDLNCPTNSTQAYAARVCRELDLGLDWYDAINAYLQKRIAEYVQDLETNPSSVPLLPTVEEVVRAAPATSPLRGRLPRIEEYDAGADLEAARLKARAAQQPPQQVQQPQQSQQPLQLQQQSGQAQQQQQQQLR